MAEAIPGDRDAIRNGLTIPYRVRFDESTPAGRMRTSALLRYAQDAAWVHSDALGYDRSWYAARGLWWVVRSVELRLDADVPLGSDLAVRTSVAGFRKVWARRRTDVRLADGPAVGWLHTDWVITDERGAPTRVPATFPAEFDAPPGTFEPVRVPLPAPPDDAQRDRSPVRRHELDPMDHVNNGVYLDRLEDAIAGAPGGGDALERTPRAIRLEYLAQAGAGDVLESFVWRQGDGWACVLRTDAGADALRGLLEA
jgi:acyl-ACP thioesterase